MAENALDLAAYEESKRVEVAHVIEAQGEARDKIGLSLHENELKVLQLISSIGPCSPSNPELQKQSNLSCPTLARLLKSLASQGMVIKDIKGRKAFYTISSAYFPYFKKD